MAASEGPRPRKGNRNAFNIGHLNIEGHIRGTTKKKDREGKVKKKLEVLKDILVEGDYDVFGVTEIKLTKEEETDNKHNTYSTEGEKHKKNRYGINIGGYTEWVYPSFQATPNATAKVKAKPKAKPKATRKPNAKRGIAIYIKNDWLGEVNVTELTEQKQQDIEMIEMVKVKFAKFRNDKLEITFIYRPQGKNQPCFKDILRDKEEPAIIMGDMNFDWKEGNIQKAEERLTIFGVQQLVTEVTRPVSETIIDHIWISRGIIDRQHYNQQDLGLLDCDSHNLDLLTYYQNMIDTLCWNGLQPLSDVLRKKLENQLDCEQSNHQHREELSRLVRGVLRGQLSKEYKLLLDCKQLDNQLTKTLEMVKDYQTEDRQLEYHYLNSVLDGEQINYHHREQRTDLNVQLTKNLKCLLESGETKHQHLKDLTRKHEKHCKLLLDRGHGVDTYSTDMHCSDHCIIWIALRHPAKKHEEQEKRSEKETKTKTKKKEKSKKQESKYGSNAEQIANMGREWDYTPGVGNCMFESVAKQISDPEKNARSLRDLACNQGSNYIEKYINFFGARESKNAREEYLNDLKSLRQDKVWNLQIADLVINMLSDALDRKIVVLRDNEKPTIIGDDRKAIDCDTIVIAQNASRDHYDATRKRPPSTLSKGPDEEEDDNDSTTSSEGPSSK